MLTFIWLLFAAFIGAGVEFLINYPDTATLEVWRNHIDVVTWIGPTVGFVVGLLIRLGDVEGVGDVLGGFGD